MKYWDASALVPLFVQEPGTKLARAWLEEDPEIVTWGLTSVEMQSAIERRAREGTIAAQARRTLLEAVEELSGVWDEITDLLTVRQHALSLIARHPLRAADALQLGAALVVSEGKPSSVTFVCFDANLADAAQREGFDVQTWPR